MNTTSQPHTPPPLMKKTGVDEQHFRAGIRSRRLFFRNVWPLWSPGGSQKNQVGRRGGGLGGGGQVRAIIPCQATHCLPPSPGASLYIPLPHSCTSMYHLLAPPCTSPVPIIPCQATHCLSAQGNPSPQQPPRFKPLVKNAIGRTKSFFDWTKNILAWEIKR